MQGQRTKNVLPSVLARRRNAIIASASAGILFNASGLLINVNFTEVAADDFLSVLAIASLCLAPFLGLPAVLLGAGDLKSIQRKIIPSSLYATASWGHLLGLIGTACNSILLLVFAVQALSVSGSGQARESMTVALTDLVHQAHQYRLRPDTADGASGSYVGFVLDPQFSDTEEGSYAARVVHPDTIQFVARWREDSTSAIAVTVGPDGNAIGPWTFYGEFAN